jgi:predicted CoA-binding protein
MVGSTVPTIPRFQNPPDSVIRAILSQPQRIAVVGCSPDPSRDSHRIARLLIDKGHSVVPVHPGATEILERRCYPSLRSIPEPIDMIDIFRRADQVGPIVDEAIAIGAQIIWMQLGVIDAAAALRAQAAGLTVIMDRCPAIEYGRLFP